MSSEQTIEQPSTTEPTMKKIYLYIPFDYRDYAKSNGMKWDFEIHLWYCMMSPEQIKNNSHPLDRFRLVFFDCPIRLADKVKELGAVYRKAERRPFTYRGNFELLKLLKLNPRTYEPIQIEEKKDEVSLDIFIDEE